MSYKDKKFKILIASTLLVFLIILGVYFYYTDNLDKKIKDIFGGRSEDKVLNCDVMRKLDGVCVKKGDENLWPVALMIDNHPDSWPQSGLSQAQLVYNTLTEGGHTRLMAVYTTASEIEEIGPVRSARPYYLTWAKGLDALYGHSGGSPEAIKKIKSYGILNWEEATSYGPDYFWRDDTKVSPHNLFTSNEKIQQARIDWELADKVPEYWAWKFATNTATELIQEQSTEQSIYIDYSPGVLFDVEYKYDGVTQTYLRFQNQSPQIDALTGEQIRVKNIIIQFVPEEIHLDVEDRLAIETTGIDKAWIFYNGQMIEASWAKKEISNRTYFSGPNGREVIFQPGNIWIEVVPGDRNVDVGE